VHGKGSPVTTSNVTAALEEWARIHKESEFTKTHRKLTDQCNNLTADMVGWIVAWFAKENDADVASLADTWAAGKVGDNLRPAMHVAHADA
jgi:hypothetical protein